MKTLTPPNTQDQLTKIRSTLFSDDLPRIYSTGIKNLGLKPSTITLISAPPGEGKSSLASQLMFDSIRMDPTLKMMIANVEMTFAQIIMRELARVSGVNLSDIQNKTWEPQEKEQVETAYQQIESLADSFCYLEMPFDLKTVAKQIEIFEPDIVCLDYVQLIKIDSSKERQENRIEIEQAMNVIRRMANLGIAFIVISAINRNTTGNAYKSNLNLGRMSGSSSIEYAVDDLYILESDQDEPENKRLHHLKSRNSELRSIDLRFTGQIQKWGAA